MYLPKHYSDKYKEYLIKYQNFTEIVAGAMCKGVNPEALVKASLAPFENRDPLSFHVNAFAEVGKAVTFPEANHWKDTSDDYAKKMVDSGNWEQIVPEFGEDFYPLLQDHDILTWAYSRDGTEGCNDKAGMNGGNTTTGFLIEASDDYPTLAYAICSYVPSGVFPLSEVLTNQEHYGSGLKARLIYIHRWKGEIK
tara:strand:+ start:181 stop:765 length:585 start_codon:yes stop_codon:yes gene_type:complete